MSHANLWAPWRMAYIQDLAAPRPGGSDCFLCDAGRTAANTPEARQQLLLINDDRGAVMMNRYPYTNGHLLVLPPEHVGQLTDLTPQRRAGLMELTALMEGLLRDTLHAQGVNVGVNLGACAGAGVPGHLHIHVLPRWNGDTNFMSTVAQVRVSPQALETCYQQLTEALTRQTES